MGELIREEVNVKILKGFENAMPEVIGTLSDL
jgi:hypothetical protein